MTPGQAGATPLMLPDGRFSGRSEFAALVRQAMAAVSAQGWREMIWCDPDFDDWPLDSPRCTGVAGADLARRTALKARLSEHLSGSSAGFPATVLGL